MYEPFIRGVRLLEDDDSSYPYSIPAVKDMESMRLTKPVTFLVGENGSGKSTIIEALAVAAGFNAEGGTKNYNFSSQYTVSSLADAISLIRGPKREKGGYFLRAESFYTMASYADRSLARPFDGRRLHEQSHGEAFLAIAKNFRKGLCILDEPESALSPQRQLALLVIIHDLVKQGSQFIIATHSPILLAYPDALIYRLSHKGMTTASYEDIEHVNFTRDFLNNPSQYLNSLLAD